MCILKISNNLQHNITALEKSYKNAADFTKVMMKTGGTEIALLSLDGQIDKQYLSIGVATPIVNSDIQNINGLELMDYIKTNILAVVEQVDLYTLEEISEKIMLGFAAILIDGCDFAVSFGVQGYKVRSVSDPIDETMLRGAKEGFIESSQINMSLIRRRLRTDKLKFERISVGLESNTPIIVSYLEEKVSKPMLNKLKKELNNVEIEGLLSSTYLSGLLNKGGIFGTVGVTERPDTVSSKLQEGKIALIVDGSPFVLVVPFLFMENFESFDDYATKPAYASYMRYIKYICFFIAAYLPGAYMGIITGRPELIPTNLLINIATNESKTPFNVFWELILANLFYEIMREAGLRAPKVFSQSISIVGALVIGDMAVSAGLMGSPSLIVIATSAIAGYAIPKLYEQLSLIRISVLIISGVFGFWGTVLSFMFILYNICCEESFNIPLTSPIAPFKPKYISDILMRKSWKKLQKGANDDK